MAEKDYRKEYQKLKHELEVKDRELLNASGRYLSDGLHPNVAGQIEMAKLYARVIINSQVLI